MARAALRSLRYLSRYFSFWFLRAPLFVLGFCSEELVGDGKVGAETPDPELEMEFCGAEPRIDWAVKACRACCRSSSVWGNREGEKAKDVFCAPAVPEDCAGFASRMMYENTYRQVDDKIMTHVAYN